MEKESSYKKIYTEKKNRMSTSRENIIECDVPRELLLYRSETLLNLLLERFEENNSIEEVVTHRLTDGLLHSHSSKK